MPFASFERINQHCSNTIKKARQRLNDNAPSRDQDRMFLSKYDDTFGTERRDEFMAVVNPGLWDTFQGVLINPHSTAEERDGVITKRKEMFGRLVAVHQHALEMRLRTELGAAHRRCCAV